MGRYLIQNGTDMKQTAEEAARGYSNDCRNRQRHCEPYCIVDFISGAEWQSKQSPWISVKERLQGNGGGEAYIDFCDGQLCVSVVIEGKQADFNFEPVTLRMFAHAYKLHCEECEECEKKKGE